MDGAPDGLDDIDEHAPSASMLPDGPPDVEPPSELAEIAEDPS